MKLPMITVLGALLKNALSDLRQNKLRSFLSAMAMFLGVLTVVVCSAVGDAAVDMVVAYEEQTSARSVTFSAMIAAPRSNFADTAATLQEELEKRLRPGSAFSLVSTSNGFLVAPWPSNERPQQGRGLTVEWDAGDLSRIRRVATLSGEFPLATSAYPPKVALNEIAAQELGYPSNNLLAIFQDKGEQPIIFEVGAVIADGDTQARAYGTIEALVTFFVESAHENLDIRFTTRSTDDAYVRQVLNDIVEDKHLQLVSDLQRVDTAWTIVDQIGVLTTIFSSMAALLLLVAAMGILNVSLSSVNERAKELVVRRAIGARRSDVFALVMASAIIEAIVVTAIAIGVALVCVFFVLPAQIPPKYAIALPGFPWNSCVIGSFAAISTAIVGSAFPAWKASRLPVANALRE